MIGKRLFWSVLVTVAGILGITTLTFAQACPSLVQSALESIGDNCTALERNTACYGYDLVSAQFLQEVADDYFAQPSDRAKLSELAKIQTAQLNTSTNQWGVGVLNVQANVPNTLPGQAVTLILIGDAELENAVDPAEAHTPADPMLISVTRDANFRSSPSLRGNVIGIIPANQAVGADGVSPDGEWVRVVFNDRVGWLNRVTFNEIDLSPLPTLDGTQRMPMQAFYLRTGIGAPECDEATDNALVVQGPKNIKIDLTINGASMQIGSTVVYRILPDGNTMEILVIDGEVRIPNGAPNGDDLIVPAGYRSTVCLGEPNNLGVDGEQNDRVVSCAYSDPEEIPLEDIGEKWCALENISPDALNYPIDLLCEGEDVNAFIARVMPERIQPTRPPTATPSGATATPNVPQSLCDKGQAWDDGRCDNPDPALKDWYYNAGWYYKQVELGNITPDQIPPQYQIATPEPPKPEVTEVPPPPFIASWVCSVGSGEPRISWSAVPVGQTVNAKIREDGIDVFFSDIGSPPSGAYIHPCTYSGVYTFSLPYGIFLTPSNQAVFLPPITCDCYP